MDYHLILNYTEKIPMAGLEPATPSFGAIVFSSTISYDSTIPTGGIEPHALLPGSLMRQD